MIDSRPDCREADVAGGKSRWMQRGILGAVCVLVIGVYAYTAHSGIMESLRLNAADTYYNLLVQGFRVGQLSLKKEVPPGFAQLADPYDPKANILYRSAVYRLFDMSYYRGRLYLYFGVTPALILFWPFVALTGHYLLHRQAVTIFCAIGFLTSVGLLCALWRRYFAEVSVGVVAACALALGLATGVPVLLPRSEVYEVSISCGYMLTMLALGALWCASHEPKRRCRWLAAASVAYGLAVGARPSLLLGAVILLVPVIQAWRERQRFWALLMAATGPILLIGLGLMLYNYLRFDHALEFGQRYQLAGERQDTVQHFSLGYLWFNFRVYFLEPARWCRYFPFVQDMAVPPLPPGHGEVEKPFGILTNVPLVWLTLAVPLAWRGLSTEAGSTLRWFVAAVALLFGIGALTLGLYYFTASRYEVEFLSVLLLLAVVGILGLERAMAADRPVWRRAVRWGWGLLLGFSVAFNLFAGVEHYAAAHNDLGAVLMQVGKINDAIGHYEQALRINPNYADVHYNLGGALVQAGRVPEAIGHWQQAVRIKPDFAEAHYNLGNALLQTGKPKEAMGHWEQALRIRADYAEAHNDLAVALARLGRVPEATGHWEQAVRIKPDYADAHYNLGVALEQAGKIQDAIGHYEQVLRINPGAIEVQNRLARLRVAQ
jgi:tetratricopeptide (TPR) repeat protein